MEVTNVRLRCIQVEGKMRAIASITLNDAFVVHDIRVIAGRDGLFIAMPSKQMPSGKFRDIAHPINTQVRKMIQEVVLETFHREKKKDLVK